MGALRELLERLAAVVWFRPPVGATLQQRYPAAPGAFTTSYSSIDLTDDAFVAEPRGLDWRPAPRVHPTPDDPAYYYFDPHKYGTRQ